MSVPNRLYNSTADIKYIIDAEELNENFDGITEGSSLNNESIKPRHISQGATDTFMFPAIMLGTTTGMIVGEEGTVFYKRNSDGSGTFYGISADESGNLIYVVMG